MKVSGTTVIIDGKYYIREVIRRKETLYPTQWTVEDMEKAKTKLAFWREGNRLVESGQMDKREFCERFLAMP